jgi:diacylglycerol kinase (ATP)
VRTSLPLVFLVNPGAGRGGALRAVHRLLKHEPAVAAACVGIGEVASVAGAVAALDGLAPEVAAVAVGGDGTANMVASAVVAAGAPRPLAILPCGTGNALAHALGVGRWPRAVAALVSGRTTTLDLVRTNHPVARVVLVSLSFGFEAELLSVVARRRGQLSAIGAAAAGMREALRAPRPRAWLDLDGHPFLDGDEPVFNGGLYALPCYAFGLRAFCDADPRDGVAEARVSRTAAAYWRATLGGARAQRKWERARLVSQVGFQVDGEVPEDSLGALEAWVEQRGLRVVGLVKV